jgi:transcriptional regulator of acetoin/glycerol metabolism
VRAGEFRGDLYARLADFTIPTVPLRDRREDILPILVHALGASAPALAADLVDALLLHPWPFNVRELVKVAAELQIRGTGAAVLELELVRARLAPPNTPALASTESSPVIPAGATPEKDELVALLRLHRGSVADLARAAGRSRKQVYRWLERYALDLASFRISSPPER